MPKIPPALIGTVSPILADTYTHSQLNSLFLAHGFPGDPPEGNKVDKCQSWLRRGNKLLPDALLSFGQLIAEYMDRETPAGSSTWQADERASRETIAKAFGRESLSYKRGGLIFGAAVSGPSRSLAERLRSNGIGALEQEYQRAYAAIESDPPTAVTAACAILESVCKTYLEAEGHVLPKKQVLGVLWHETAKQLKLQPGQVVDDDLRRILQGLSSIADGVAAIRTHEGSAHGRSGHVPQGKTRYLLLPRHARLAVHAAHTIALFVLETWDARTKGS